jgi:hypothetical protein
MPTIRISQSLIKDHISCPKKTFYRIFLPGESISSNEMALGNAVHVTLEKAWQNSRAAIDELEIQLKEFNVKTMKNWLILVFLISLLLLEV